MSPHKISGRSMIAVLAAVALLTQASIGGIAAASPDECSFSAEPSRVAARAEYLSGEYVYTDYVFDDAGPQPPHRDVPESGRADIGRGGAAEYPHDWDRYGDNAADIVEVRVATTDHAVCYQVLFSTMFATDAVVFTLAVDEDQDLGTGGGSWRRGANLSLGGWDRLYTVWGTGGEIATPDGTVIDLVASGGSVAVDVDANLISFSVPRAIADPGTATWRAWAATGLWDPSAESYLPFGMLADESTPSIRYGGGLLEAGAVPNLFNVAFRFEDEVWIEVPFGNLRQAEALAAGDISQFSASIDFGKIESDAIERVELGAGPAQLIYRSTLPGEGIVDIKGHPCYEFVSVDNDPTKHPTCLEFFLSPYQPYLLYLPESADRSEPLPVLMSSHGYAGYHATFALSSWVDLIAFVEQQGVLFVNTLGRGQGTGYVRHAEADALELLADLHTRFDLDADRVHLVGGSHSGAFVLFMTSLYPDLFAGGVATVPGYVKKKGFGVENDVVGQVTYVPAGEETYDLQDVQFSAGDLVENLRNVPLHIITGDEDLHTQPGRFEAGFADRMFELGYEFMHYGCSPASHAGLAAPPNLRYESLRAIMRAVRNPNPREVVYKGNTRADVFAEPLGLRHDGAYWVGDLGPADDSAHFLARALSFAVPAAQTEVIPMRGVRLVEDNRYPVACRYQGNEHVRLTDPLPERNELSLELSNVETMTVDALRARLDLSGPLTITATSSAPAILRLEGLSPTTVSATMDGAPFEGVSLDGGTIVLEAAAGEHDFVLTD